MKDFNKFYSDNFHNFHTYAYIKVRKSDVAKDIVQESFVKFWQRLDTIDIDKHENWIKVVIKNKCMDYHRNKKRDKELLIGNFGNDAYDTLDDILNTPDDSYDILQRILEANSEECESTKQYDNLIKHIEALAPSYNSVFKMFVIDNLSHKEISRELNISEGTSKSTLSRARVILKKLIKNV